MASFSNTIKKSIGGDEYYSPQNVVDMIVPYVMKGGTKGYGVRSIPPRAASLRPSKI